MKTVFITGGSGKLGQQLVSFFLQQGWKVLAHYHQKRPFEADNLLWLQGDFSSAEKLSDFLIKNSPLLKASNFFLQLYGPLKINETEKMQTADFLQAFWSNFLVSVEFWHFFRRQKDFQKIVCFDFLDRRQGYRKVLSYAVAKRAQRLWLKSLARTKPAYRLQLIAFSSYQGADCLQPGGKVWEVSALASAIGNIVLQSRRFYHRLV